MRKSAQLSVAFAICLTACSSEEPGRVETAAGDAPAMGGSVTLAATPPMGFNTWNRFGCDVSDELVRGIADAMVESGMRDAGYQYVVIDDCWQVDRGDDGLIVPDPERFPSGMKELADYVHGKGLKFGLYTDAGPKTCEGRPGSLGYEEVDANTYAEWGAGLRQSGLVPLRFAQRAGPIRQGAPGVRRLRTGHGTQHLRVGPEPAVGMGRRDRPAVAHDSRHSGQLGERAVDPRSQQPPPRRRRAPVTGTTRTCWRWGTAA